MDAKQIFRWSCADAPVTAAALKMIANAARRATVVLMMSITLLRRARLR
jgi:hypothetical protein